MTTDNAKMKFKKGKLTKAVLDICETSDVFS